MEVSELPTIDESEEGGQYESIRLDHKSFNEGPIAKAVQSIIPGSVTVEVQTDLSIPILADVYYKHCKNQTNVVQENGALIISSIEEKNKDEDETLPRKLGKKPKKSKHLKGISKVNVSSEISEIKSECNTEISPNEEVTFGYDMSAQNVNEEVAETSPSSMHEEDGRLRSQVKKKKGKEKLISKVRIKVPKIQRSEVKENSVKIQCKKCKLIYSSDDFFNKHECEMKVYLKPFSCVECDVKFSTMDILQRHEENHVKEKKNSCKVCYKSYVKMSLLKIHQRKHTGEKPYQCEECSKAFRYLPDYTRHRRVHTGEQAYICKVCNSNFKSLIELRYHKREHKEIKTFHCDICDKVFLNLHRLKRHQMIHTGEKPYLCELCSKAFNQSNDLKRHMVLHTGEKPFKCKLCDEMFKTPTGARRHERKHTGEKPFCCEICNKLFAEHHHLKVHRLIHTGERPHVCTVCNKAFTKSSGLKRHQQLHSSQPKPFSCEDCTKTFARKDHLLRHATTHIKEPNISVAKNDQVDILKTVIDVAMQESAAMDPHTSMGTLPLVISPQNSLGLVASAPGQNMNIPMNFVNNPVSVDSMFFQRAWNPQEQMDSNVLFQMPYTPNDNGQST